MCGVWWDMTGHHQQRAMGLGRRCQCAPHHTRVLVARVATPSQGSQNLFPALVAGAWTRFLAEHTNICRGVFNIQSRAHVLPHLPICSYCLLTLVGVVELLLSTRMLPFFSFCLLFRSCRSQWCQVSSTHPQARQPCMRHYPRACARQSHF